MGDDFFKTATTDHIYINDNYIYASPTVTYTDSISGARTISYPPKYWDVSTTTLPKDYEDLMKRLGQEEELKVKIDKIPSSNEKEHIIACQNKEDLMVENILKTLSAIKGRLMFDIAPIHIKEFKCNMTPEVRKNIITASKKLKMYGKKRPIIARFDDYGNKLPDELNLETANGITINIVDPEDYNEYYLDLVAYEFSNIDYSLTHDYDDMIYGIR